MFRKAIGAVVIGLLAVACTDRPASSDDGAPAPEMSRADTIAWARGIDPCALIDRDALQTLGSVTAIGTAGQSTDCEAVIERDGAKTSVSWAVAFLPTDFQTSTLGILETIDGKQVRKISAAAAYPPEQVAQLVESPCSYDIPFENAIAVRMRVSAPRDRDGCADGLPLVRDVLKNQPAQPKQGSSPATTTTVLTAAQPCASIPDLQQSHTVVFDWTDQSLNSCFLTIEGDEALVTFGYRTPIDVVTGAESTNFGDHLGYSNTGDVSTPTA